MYGENNLRKNATYFLFDLKEGFFSYMRENPAF
jgi:hypothetical protein